MCQGACTFIPDVIRLDATKPRLKRNSSKSQRLKPRSCRCVNTYYSSVRRGWTSKALATASAPSVPRLFSSRLRTIHTFVKVLRHFLYNHANPTYASCRRAVLSFNAVQSSWCSYSWISLCGKLDPEVTKSMTKSYVNMRQLHR